MQDIQYIGETLWVGQLGHFFILSAFISALFSVFAYAISHVNKDVSSSWQKMGHYLFIVHGISVFAVISLLFYAMYNHLYEYSYVFDHVSDDLPLKYTLSAFWEGQEGSFLLWMFWHVILGFLLIKYNSYHPATVMISIALAETIIMTMILGVYLPGLDQDIKIGSNPTLLLRQVNEAPIFANADYLSLIKGRGLNPLLQNYWMTIHPPVTFLGFASLIVPFAFAIAGMWRQDHTQWLRPAMPWALFSAGILGTGIFMGSLWAYEALSFGGYWSWDPVENASLVAWIAIVAGVHVHLVAKNTGYALKSVYFLYVLAFVLIIYSTFLTRSGVLGDTSAHAFTEMGLEWQLVILVAAFAILGFGLWGWRFNSMPSPKNEEKISSREFWMFIGSLVLLFSTVLISISTSLPVYNKIKEYFDPGFIGNVIQDPISHYNKYQLWIAVFITVLSSASLWLNYKGRPWSIIKSKLIQDMGISIGMAVVLTVLFETVLNLYVWQYTVLCLTSFFSLSIHLILILRYIRHNFTLLPAALGHIGFGMMILGILASGLNLKHLSSNPFVFKDIFTEEDAQKYVQLIKNKPLLSQGHIMTYETDTLVDRTRTYHIKLQKVNENLDVLNTFYLYPNAVYSNDFSKVAAYNPDTDHKISRDIFSCIVGVPPAVESAEKAKMIEDTLTFTHISTALGDTLTVDGLSLVLKNISYTPTHIDYINNPHDMGIEVDVEVFDNLRDTSYHDVLALGVDGALMYNYASSIQDLGLRIKFNDSTSTQYFADEKTLAYRLYDFKMGETKEILGYNVVLNGIDSKPQHRNYTPQAADFAIGAQLIITHTQNSINDTLAPLYIIRENMPMGIKVYEPKKGWHVKLTNIDPINETFTFAIAQEMRSNINNIDIAIATGVPRKDYIIIAITVFPGINLFWLGGILMMLGFFGAAYFRLKNKLKPIASMEETKIPA